MQIDFLQSEEWRKFQAATGKKTFHFSSKGFWANIIEHKLPLVGKYFYVPRGPICHPGRSVGESKDLNELNSSIALGMTKLLELAKQEKASWIRFDANNSETLDNICKYSRVIKAPHDMQPREVFVIDIAKPEEELLAGMSSKTRYNVRLAEKKGVSVSAISNINCHPELVSEPALNSIQGSKDNPEMLNQVQHDSSYYLNEFLRLVKVTSNRQGIAPHPESYYRKMFEVIPEKNIKLYVAEYEGKIIGANLVIFYNGTAIYLHGASDNEYRNIMATYLLQWQQIRDAKKVGCVRYDFGGISTKYEFYESTNKWKGITKFKLGFSPNTKSTEFPGSYDIVLKPFLYNLYRFLQKIKSIL